MFRTIFSFELKRWFKSWTFYLYITIFFAFSFCAMLVSLGMFDDVRDTTSASYFVNSPLMLNIFINGFNTLLYFLFPTIIGASIYRDYKYNMHHVLYAYPFSKIDYLAGKFLSSFLVTLLISLSMGLAVFIATLWPGANEMQVGPNNIMNYLQVYLFNVIPNMLFMGAIVFTVVTLTRNVYVGFVVILIVIVLKGFVNRITSDLDNHLLAAIIDPTGWRAFNYYAQYWTIDEVNYNQLPLEKWFIINRLIWLGVSAFFLLLLGSMFRFSQYGLTFSFRKKAIAEPITKNNFVGIFKIVLPKINYDFSSKRDWSNVFAFAKLDFKFLAKNKVFLILIGVGVFYMVSVAKFSMTLYGTKTLPLTRSILAIPGSTFDFLVLIMTFLGSGLLVQRGALSKMNLLVDSTATPNWVFFVSKFFALLTLQFVLLLVIMITGIGIQIYNGYYQFEIGFYLRSLFGFWWISFVIWALFSFAVQVAFRNYIVGFFVLLVFSIAFPGLSAIGIEQRMFFFNDLPTPTYSDMDAFGNGVIKFYIYAFYWLFFVSFLTGLTLLFWRRGIFSGLKERLFYAKQRASASVVIPTVLCLVGFLAIGGYLYFENKSQKAHLSAKESELLLVEYEKTYKKYESLVLPRIVDVKVNMDIYPKTLAFKAKGEYVLKNKTTQVVDSLLVNYLKEYKNTIVIEGAYFLSQDSVQGLQFYRFKSPLQPGDSVKMTFTVANKPNTLLRNNSPVLGNGTFIDSSIFPSLGYDDDDELIDNEVRKKYDLKPKERMAKQSDKKALENTYINKDSDWIRFETTVSTSTDQIAIAPGYLQKEWHEGDRRYFHYKMDQKMLNFYAFNSARYEVKAEKWNDINIEVYYHKGHPYNIDRIISSVKKSLAYYSKEFSPYQHKQVRIIEFPLTLGSFAQSFANTIPFAETIGFVADVDDSDENAVDYPFSVTSHEVAHQWWAHQVIGANVQGVTMLSESLAEYSSLKVLEKEYGKGQLQRFIKDALDSYLEGRSNEGDKEQPLMYNENQEYIHYNKGSLVFYTLSDYIGDDKLNGTLKRFIKKVAFQEAPFTTAAELVADLKEATPDSLKYMIKDMFETITLYDNYVDKAEVKKLDNGKYEVKINAFVSKYRSGEKGKKEYTDSGGKQLTFNGPKNFVIKSLPLADYVELGVFSKVDNSKELEDKGLKGEKILYLKKVKITEIENEFRIIVDEEPTEVGIDPYYKLIDTRSYDNRIKL